MKFFIFDLLDIASPFLLIVGGFMLGYSLANLRHMLGGLK